MRSLDRLFHIFTSCRTVWTTNGDNQGLESRPHKSRFLVKATQFSGFAQQRIIDDRQLQSALQYQRDHGGRLGAALVARGGKMLWVHRGVNPADIPNADALLETAREYLQT